MNYSLSDIYVYPIKSLGGIRLEKAEVDDRGIKMDRRWMLVDEEGMFLTQRKFPEMALFKVALSSANPNALVITAPSGETLSLSEPEINPSAELFSQFPKENTQMVQVWSDRCRALPIGPDFDQWFSDNLKTKARLVWMPPQTNRIVDGRYTSQKTITGFADGFPFLLANKASLDDLNQKLRKPIPMNRFRPNFVFEGKTPFEEDDFGSFSIGNIDLKAVKKCGRCQIITTDQASAKRDPEPLTVLNSYRKFGTSVAFGMNLVHFNTGTIKVGDPFTFGQRRD